MIASQPQPKDFELGKDFHVDVGNEGFAPDEMVAVTPAVTNDDNARGLIDEIWPVNREVAPELRDLKSEFGYQSHPLLTDLVEAAKAQGTELDGKVKGSLANHNFYVLQCGVYILPEGGERFEALKFEVRYKGKDVATLSMLPGPLTETKFKVGAKVDVGVNGGMNFGLPNISIQAAKASVEAKAKLESTFIYSFSYELKTQVVDSFGIGNQFCRWLMYQGKNLRNDVLFYPVIITSKTTTGFECEFRASFKIGHSKWKSSEFFIKPPRKISLSA
jgi:hypothetical protein